MSYVRALTICLLLVYFVSAAGCHCFDTIMALLSRTSLNTKMESFYPEARDIKSVQSALSDLKRPPERLRSQCNYRLFIT